MKKIAILGAGHIGTAIIKGLVSADNHLSENIIATNVNESELLSLGDKFSINTTTDNREAVEKADIIIIAVKPFTVASVISGIKDIVQNKTIISVAAGVTISQLEKYFGSSGKRIIRIMPNMPIAVNSGVIGLLANNNVSADEKEEIVALFSKLGKVFTVDSEEEFIFFGLTPGCGPALVSYCIEMFAKSAIAYGFSKEQSEAIALQIFSGTLLYLQESQQSPQQLKQAVATKGGITEQILSTLDGKDFSKIFISAIAKGREKITSLEKEMQSKVE